MLLMKEIRGSVTRFLVGARGFPPN